MQTWMIRATLAALLVVLSTFPPADAGEPDKLCCIVISVDAKRGTLRVRNQQTLDEATLEVRNDREGVLTRFYAGQQVSADALLEAVKDMHEARLIGGKQTE